MKKLTKFLAVLMAVVLMCGMFAACGKKSEVAKIQKSGKLIVLTNAALPPFEYREGEGTIIGADIDLCQAIANELGVELEIVNMDLEEIASAIYAGKGNIAAARITVAEEYQETVGFTDSYILDAQYMVVPVGSNIKTAADLEGKVIGVQKDSPGDGYATEKVGAKSIERYASSAEAGAALMASKVDVVIAQEIPAKAIAEQNAEKLQVIDEKLTEAEYALGIAKDSDLLEVANKVISDSKAEGRIEEFILKHTME